MEKSGTPAYIAPEVLNEDGYSGFKSDYWSCGVVLYALLYGSVPFKAAKMKELHKLILKGKFELKETISLEARDLILNILNPDVKNRYDFQKIIRHHWFAKYNNSGFIKS